MSSAKCFDQIQTASNQIVIQTDQTDCKSKAVSAIPECGIKNSKRGRTMRTLNDKSTQSKGT